MALSSNGGNEIRQNQNCNKDILSEDFRRKNYTNYETLKARLNKAFDELKKQSVGFARNNMVLILLAFEDFCHSRLLCQGISIIGTL